MIAIYHNLTDITEYVINSVRDKILCSGVGTLHVELAVTYPTAITLYDTFTIYEDGVKKGIFYVHTVNKDLPTATITVSCQDASILLESYFIDESFFVDYPSDSADWIRRFLTDATVSYSFDSGTTGSNLNNDTTLGMMSASDQITTLLQQNGWYIKFDEDNVAHIGKVNANMSSPALTVNGDDILSIKTNNHDKMFRNRVVVWGKGDPNTSRWVHADLDQSGKYENEYDANDVRSIVMANSNINSAGTANLYASRLMKEFEQTNYEIELDLAGFYDLDVGDVLGVSSEFLNTTGIITTLSVTTSGDGMVTHVKLNERCPRLFSFYEFDGYVYVGTNGAGVWRKPLKYSHTWENFSTGLTSLDIVDLAIKDNTFACVTSDGKLFTRYLGDSGWGRLAPSFIDPVTSGYLPASSGVCTSCAIDKTTGNVLATFHAVGDDNKGWIVDSASRTSYTTRIFRDNLNNTEYRPLSIDNNATENVVVVETLGTEGGIDLFNHWLCATQDSEFLYEPIGEGYTISGLAYNSTTNIGHQFVGTSQYFYDVFWPTSYSMRIIKVAVNTVEVVKDVTIDITSAGIEHDDFNQRIFIAGEDELYLATHNYNNNLDSSGTLGLAVHSISLDGSSITLEAESGDLLWDDYFFGYGYIQKTNGIRIICYHAVYDTDTGVYGVGAWIFNTATASAVECVPKYPTTLYVMSGSNWNYYSTELQAPYWDSFDRIVGHPMTDKCLALIGARYTRTGFTGIYYNPVLVNIDSNNNITLNESYLPGIAALGLEILMRNVSTSNLASGAGHDDSIYFYTDTGYSTYPRAVIRLGLTDWENVDLFSGSMVFDYAGPSLWGKSKGLLVLDAASGFGFYSTKLEDFLSYYTDTNSVDSYTFDDTDLIPTYSRSSFNGTATLTLRIYDPINNTSETLETYTATSTNHNFHRIIPMGDYFVFYIYDANFTVSRPQFVVPNTRVAVSGGGGSDSWKVMKGKITYTSQGTIGLARNVEISQGQPVILYGGISYSGIVVSGNPTWTNIGEIFVSPLGTAGTYSSVLLGANKSYVPDARSAKWLYDNEGEPEFRNYVLFPELTSGVITNTNTYLRVLDVTDDLPAVWYPNSVSGILASGTFILHTFSGFANHIETSNYQDYPYIFASIKTTPPIFWQKDSYDWGEIATPFENRSTGLPNYEITCIRTDDYL